MTHLVKYTKSDGQTGEHETEELADAIAQVERLRNHEGVESARIFRIEEIAFEFKPYYRVEIGGPADSAAAHSDVTVPPAAADAKVGAPAAENATESPAADEIPANTGEADSSTADEATSMIDPWADAPPPPPPPAGDAEPEAEPVSTGRRGLFSR